MDDPRPPIEPRVDSTAGAPILVTGMHRSGTTWVGRMMALTGEVAFLGEPLNPNSPGPLLSFKTLRQYSYIAPENEDFFLDAYELLTAFEYPLYRECLAIREPKDALRVARRAVLFGRARRRGARALLKDPFAVFSIPWLWDRFGCIPIVTVRHPAAVVSSLQRLGWRFDFAQLLDQPLLMAHLLAPYESAMESLRRSPSDIVEHGSLLWKIVYSIAQRFEREYNAHLYRHEDLSIDPIGGYGALYDLAGLQFDEQIASAIRNFTDSRNPTELSIGRPNEVRLDSRANLSNWKERLTSDDVDRIRALTEGVVEQFYPDFDDATSKPKQPDRVV
jgi:hypothetical protein